MKNEQKPSINNLFLSFLKLGATAFGGPAMVSYIRKMAVEQKKWLDEDSFKDGVALCQTVPGATAMQTAAYVGLRSRGIFGAVASFVGFGLPAFIIMMILSVVYSQTHSLSKVISAFNGLQIIVIAIVANATISFSKTSLKNLKDAIILIISIGMFAVGASPISVIFIAALSGYILYKNMPIQKKSVENEEILETSKTFIFLLVIIVFLGLLLFVFQRKYFDIAILMSKIDLMAFGGGFASVPLMYHEIVSVRGWIDNAVFLDGIALGQITPGPIVITATFIGYLVYGLIGGLITTIGVFLPSFLVVVGITPYFDRIRKLSFFDKAIKGILCSFVALLFTVTLKFAFNMHWDILRISLAIASFITLYLKVEIYWVVLIGVVFSLIVL